ncbi:ATP-binding protein [Nocardia bovistercoris]|uniref:Anti-sigma factor n=1 Tax=Nocardia bovistercoris TaxID=2785916 RepID=A0A931IHD0_9NOCA|nr:anti-sigma factor [Nocardia bovistercoris]MBH0780405.1 anti-sigma factor [Nocardia bovistercoris]
MGERLSRSATDTTTVGVRVPARLDQLIMVRALAETISLIADFALDEVTDIRLALDEVATSLVLDAADDTELECRFSYEPGRMRVRVTSVAASDTVSAEAGFGYHILRTLTESVRIERADHDRFTGGYPTVIEFCWARAATDGR